MRTIVAITPCTFGARASDGPDGWEVETAENGAFWIIDYADRVRDHEERFAAYIARKGTDVDAAPFVCIGDDLADVLGQILRGDDLRCDICGGRGELQTCSGTEACGACAGGHHEHEDRYSAKRLAAEAEHTRAVMLEAVDRWRNDGGRA